MRILGKTALYIIRADYIRYLSDKEKLFIERHFEKSDLDNSYLIDTDDLAKLDEEADPKELAEMKTLVDELKQLRAKEDEAISIGLWT